jgi:ankyrin repeat protein
MPTQIGSDGGTMTGRRTIGLAIGLIVMLLAVRGCAQARLNSGLVVAAMDGNAARARTLLREGADPNAKGPKDIMALAWAASKGHEEVVQVLLQAGADPDCRNGSLKPIKLAKEHHHPGIVRLLRRAGARERR